MQNWVKVRIRETGQVLDMEPNAARAMLNSGRGELVQAAAVETAAVTPAAERAIAPAQEKKPRKKGK